MKDIGESSIQDPVLFVKNLYREDVQEELVKRARLGFSPKPKEVVIEVRKKAWKYYGFRRDIVRVLYHEVYHANDLEDLEEGEYHKLIPREEYIIHPREIRARAFEKRMFRCLKEKRKLFTR